MSYRAIIKMAAEKSKENNVVNSNDYMKNGLLHCGKCNTPKQIEINLMGDIMKPYCMCRCTEEEYRLEKAVLEKNQYDIETDILRDKAFPSHQVYSPDKEDMRKWTFANQDGSNPKIMLAAERYSENFDKCFREGLGFIFYGNVGAGKSYVAASIINALVEKHYPALMTTFGRIRSEISDDKKKSTYLDSLNQYALLVIDDLFSESDTEYMKEITFQVIDERISNRLPLIVTTNLTKEEMNNPADIRCKRILSRVKEKCRPILFDGPDKRIKTAAESVALMKEIIGI